MNFYAMFFTNVSILITCAYLFNLIYKYLFLHTSVRVKEIAVVVIFIFAGWLTMFFGIRIGATAVFDLRVVPLIFGTLVFRKPFHLFVVGTGIALARFTISGLTGVSWSGFSVYLILTVAAVLLMQLYRRRSWSYRRRALTSILAVNTLQVLAIVSIGAMPRAFYLEHIAVYTYPMGLLMSAFFVFIIRDFYKEQLRVDELRNMNMILRRQTRELREAKRQLEEKARQLLLASRYKSEFMANMSHELKTPLNSIILLSQLIREEEEEDRGEGREEGNDELRYAEIIHDSGNELLQMINDILDLSKVEAGKMDVIWEKVSVEEITQLLQHQLQPLAEKKGLAFTVGIAADVPPTILSDALRASQILRNLLNNAIKFTDQGGVTMTVSLVQDAPWAGPGTDAQSSHLHGRSLRGRWYGAWGRADRSMPASARRGVKRHGGAADSPGWVVFAVRDTGIGIEPDKQQLIFEAFQQEDGAINRKYGGTGLGLSISLQLARLLGGTLSLSSAKGEGSEFSLRLPLKPAGAKLEDAAADDGDGEAEPHAEAAGRARQTVKT